MKIVIAPDSFKGSLSALNVAKAMAEGARVAHPGVNVTLMPMADGGEGTIDALEKSVSRRFPVTVKSPTGDAVSSSFVTLPYQGEEVAVIECARSTGLTLVPEHKRDQTALNSFGLGEQIKYAVQAGVRELVVSLGGSATTDGGTGMLQALGYRLFNEKGEELPNGRNVLGEVARIDDRDVLAELKKCEITVACDVTNPFYGENGAAYVYAPQKGATDEQVARLDEGLRQFASVVFDQMGVDLQQIEGAGAAGGLGGALAGVLGARMESGFSIVADLVGLEEAIRTADLVLTGEGSLDAQSAHGKVPMSVAKLADSYGIPAVGLAGAVDIAGRYDPLRAVFSVQTGPCLLEEALEETRAYENIKHVAEQVVRMFV